MYKQFFAVRSASTGTHRRVGPRCFGIALAVATLGTGQTAYDHMRADGRTIETTRIAEGIYQFTTLRDGYVRQLNSIAIETRDDVIVFDTNTRASSAAIILSRIRTLA